MLFSNEKKIRTVLLGDDVCSVYESVCAIYCARFTTIWFFFLPSPATANGNEITSTSNIEIMLESHMTNERETQKAIFGCLFRRNYSLWHRKQIGWTQIMKSQKCQIARLMATGQRDRFNFLHRNKSNNWANVTSVSDGANFCGTPNVILRW